MLRPDGRNPIAAQVAGFPHDSGAAGRYPIRRPVSTPKARTGDAPCRNRLWGFR
jgi:hypothetical protein